MRQNYYYKTHVFPLTSDKQVRSRFILTGYTLDLHYFCLNNQAIVSGVHYSLVQYKINCILPCNFE